MTKTPADQIVPNAHTTQLLPSPRRLARAPAPALRRRHVVHTAREWLREFLSPAPPKSYLGPDELCLVRTRLHWLVPLRRITQAAVAMPLAILLTVALAFLAPGVWWLQAGLWVATLVHQGWLFYTVLLWRAEQIVVTDKRLIRVHGVVTTTVDALHLDKITDTTYHRSFLGHVFDYGSLRIESAGQKQSLERIDFVPHPEVVYRATLPT